MTLQQLLTAEQLEQAALTALAIDPAVSATLAGREVHRSRTTVHRGQLHKISDTL
jgi:hypothetical protein